MPNEAYGVFLLLALIAVAGTAGAMLLRNPVHCILSLTVGFVGLAGLYLELGAQFVGFTQVLVYVGAVAILAVFALMMTRGGEARALLRHESRVTREGVSGVLVAVGVFGILAWAVRSYRPQSTVSLPQPAVAVNRIGVALMRPYVVPLEMIAVLLTAALIGAVVVAMQGSATQAGQEKP